MAAHRPNALHVDGYECTMRTPASRFCEDSRSSASDRSAAEKRVDQVERNLNFDV